MYIFFFFLLSFRGFGENQSEKVQEAVRVGQPVAGGRERGKGKENTFV